MRQKQIVFYLNGRKYLQKKTILKWCQNNIYTNIKN